MKTYSEFRPSAHDTAGPGLEDRQTWYVAPCTRNRDSSVLEECNWDQQLQYLTETAGPVGNGWEIYSFGHWACGWLEIVLIDPTHARLVEAGEQIASDLDAYPILCDEGYNDACMRVAAEVWRDCYSTKERIAWLRRHRTLHVPTLTTYVQGCTVYTFADLLGAARGRFFIGDECAMAEGY